MSKREKQVWGFSYLNWILLFLGTAFVFSPAAVPIIDALTERPISRITTLLTFRDGIGIQIVRFDSIYPENGFKGFVRKMAKRFGHEKKAERDAMFLVDLFSRDFGYGILDAVMLTERGKITHLKFSDEWRWIWTSSHLALYLRWVICPEIVLQKLVQEETVSFFDNGLIQIRKRLRDRNRSLWTQEDYDRNEKLVREKFESVRDIETENIFIEKKEYEENIRNEILRLIDIIEKQ